MKIREILLLLSLISVTSCRKAGEEYLNSTCIGKTEFSIDSNSKLWLKSYVLNNNYLTLRNFNNPSDTFFLRVERSVENQLRILEYSKYKSKENFILYKFPIAQDGLILFNKSTNNIRDFTTHFDPAKKGKKFLSTLEKFDIISLPSAETIPGYRVDEYEHGVHIEYQNKCRFKILFYPNVQDKKKLFKEAEAVSSFLEYLTNEFDF